MSEKISIQLEKVQKTLLLPLWGRAVETQQKEPLLVDRTAYDIVGRIDYDFSEFSRKLSVISQKGWILRSLFIDRIICQFIGRHPNATIVNIGCGFDTTFERIDNGKVLWYDLDLPDVIEIRKQFIQENERRKFIAKSFLDYEWINELEVHDNVLLIAAGVLYYFEEDQIKGFFNQIAESFPESEIVFDATSPVGMKMANKTVIEKSGMGEESFLKWGLKKAQDVQLLDHRLEVLDEIPFFKNMMKRLSFKDKILAILSDALKMQYLIHLKIIKR